MTTFKTNLRNAFVTAYWTALWLLVIAALWVWLVVLPGIGLAALVGVVR